jgi:alpha-L-fucosidase
LCDRGENYDETEQATCPGALVKQHPDFLREGRREPSAAHQEIKPQKDARMKWWRDARFGLFIHWGIYSVPAGIWKGKPVDGIGEWIMHNGRILVADYAKFTSEFNPVKLNE